jgi:hypothetical protein
LRSLFSLPPLFLSSWRLCFCFFYRRQQHPSASLFPPSLSPPDRSRQGGVGALLQACGRSGSGARAAACAGAGRPEPRRRQELGGAGSRARRCGVRGSKRLQASGGGSARARVAGGLSGWASASARRRAAHRSGSGRQLLGARGRLGWCGGSGWARRRRGESAERVRAGGTQRASAGDGCSVTQASPGAEHR